LAQNIIRITKSRRMRWLGQITYRGNMKNVYKILVRKPDGERPLEDLGVDGRITLKWILKNEGKSVWTAFIWLRIETSGRLL
jgi:hypothetical protein